MRIVVTGASGNIGTSVVEALRGDHQVVGLARREAPALGVEWAALDVARDDLRPALRGADAVVHLAWAINPSRDREELERINVRGSRAVFEAAAELGVPTIVHASSIGVYSAGPKDRLVDESWPATGIAGFTYSAHKVAVERFLDLFEAAHPDVRVVRMRPALVLKPEAASHLRRELVGAWLPNPLLHPALLRLLPRHPHLRVQVAHTSDVAQAFRAAVLDDRARGPYNLAADPVIDGPTIARALGSRTVPVPKAVLKALHSTAYALRIVPGEPGWTDETLGAPLVDSSRARTDLGWEPRFSALDAFLETLEGLRRSAGAETPPLDPGAGGPLRLKELAGSAGARFSN